MKKLLLLIPLLLGLTPIKTTDVNDIQSVSNQNFTDIDTWKRGVDTRDFIQLTGYTSAVLVLKAPEKLYQCYWNSDTMEIWISTGTTANDFKHK